MTKIISGEKQGEPLRIEYDIEELLVLEAILEKEVERSFGSEYRSGFETPPEAKKELAIKQQLLVQILSLIKKTLPVFRRFELGLLELLSVEELEEIAGREIINFYDDSPEFVLARPEEVRQLQAVAKYLLEVKKGVVAMGESGGSVGREFDPLFFTNPLVRSARFLRDLNKDNSKGE